MKTRLARRVMAVMASAVLLLGACGSDGGGGANAGGDGNDGGGLSGEITLITIRNLTGPIGPPGKRVLDGQQFAVDEINASGMLGGATLKLESIDVGSDIQQAVNAVTSVAAENKTPLAFSPVFSTQVLGMAPIAQREKLPFVVVSAGVPGVVEAGDHVFRITPPQTATINRTVDCMAKAGVKKVAMAYTDFNATNAGLGKDTLPDLFRKAGITVTSEGYPQGTTDFSAVVSRLLSSKPDAVGLLSLNVEFPSLITQLERQGFTGKKFAHAGTAAVDLQPVSQAAEGMVWTAPFSPEAPAASTQKFAQAWTKAEGSPPDSLHAEGYDAVYFAAHALKQAGSTDRAAVQKAMLEVSNRGFDGAMGKLSFDTRDARSDGALLEWKGGKIALSDGCQ